MAGFVLRVKTKSGHKIVNDLSIYDKPFQLKKKLAEISGVPVDALQVLVGFPPKPVNLDVGTAIEHIGIVSGDTLIVEEKKTMFNGEEHRVDQENLTDVIGVLMKKVVPADNSCLFTSVNYVLNGKVDTSCAGSMRRIISNAVAEDPEEYSEAVLGRPNAEYSRWILKDDSWGGAIELSILSKYYGLEIAVVDSINAIVNRFGEDQRYGHRVFLIFDGIHYDPLYLEPIDGGSIQTMFPTEDKRILLGALELAREAKSSRQFTDVQKFTLMCNDCLHRMNGQIAAQQHAKDTGHKNFGEIA